MANREQFEYNRKSKKELINLFKESNCNYCNSLEITYNQLVMDSYCSECGQWQGD